MVVSEVRLGRVALSDMSAMSPMVMKAAGSPFS